MAEACQLKENSFNAHANPKGHSEINKQDCSSPSPTETEYIDPNCPDIEPGKC